MGVPTMNDISALLERALPLLQNVAYGACPERADELACDALEELWERYQRNPDRITTLLSAPATAIGVFHQVTRAVLSDWWHEETRADSLDAGDYEQVSEIEWGAISEDSAIARQRGKRVSYVPYLATEEETETLIANLAKASWGGLDALDIADVIRTSDELRRWLSGFAAEEIGKPAALHRAIQTLQNQI